MLYIHKACCISPQHSFGTASLDRYEQSVDNQLRAIEPAYEGIPRNIIRRMGKAVRMGIGAALPLLHAGVPVNGIILGTANGGMEDSVSFLKQIIAYDEGLLTPGNFVQSTANAAASQLSLISGNRGFNSTHVHRGLAFENAIMDAAMLLAENQEANYILGGLDEIASYNYELEKLDGWYPEETISNTNLYTKIGAGTIAGEGSALFLVNNQLQNSLARLCSVKQHLAMEPSSVKKALEAFLKENGDPEIDIFLSGENGDSQMNPFYTACEAILRNSVAVCRYKHLSGEYPTVSAFAVWLACELLNDLAIPDHCLKNKKPVQSPSTVLIYHNHKNLQHSFILLSKKG